MANLAVIIGISEYKNYDPLPACNNDANTIHTILHSTDKFQQILFLKGNIESEVLKNELIDFIEQHKNNEHDELFFYFSGHGHSDADDFYYITSNTDMDKPNSTTLQNTELDTLLRQLKPKLFIKIVDACRSGILYIKGNNPIIEPNDIFSKSLTEKAFNHCYFMYSSQAYQNSYASNFISYFTESFINCIKNAPKESPLRYKHIIDSISDYFLKDERQKPFFITQADMTEEFCETTETIIKALNQVNDVDVVLNKEHKDLSTRIQASIEKCITEDMARQIVDNIYNKIQEFTINDNAIEQYYTIIYDDGLYFSSSKIPNNNPISKWIEDNEKELKLFASPVYRFENDGFFFGSKKKYLDGYESSAGLKNCFSLTLTPSAIGLPKFSLFFVFIYSHTAVHVFYNYFTFMPKSWKGFELESNIMWKYIKISNNLLSDNYSEKVMEILPEFKEHIINSLNLFVE